MQFKLFSIIALATLAVATPTRRTGGGNECTTGPVQCCDTLQSPDSEPAATLLGLLNVVVHDVGVLIGVTCTPITIGGGGNACSGQTLCCKNNDYSGVVAIGCVPINIGL